MPSDVNNGTAENLSLSDERPPMEGGAGGLGYRQSTNGNPGNPCSVDVIAFFYVGDFLPYLCNDAATLMAEPHRPRHPRAAQLVELPARLRPSGVAAPSQAGPRSPARAAAVRSAPAPPRVRQSRGPCGSLLRSSTPRAG